MTWNYIKDDSLARGKWESSYNMPIFHYYWHHHDHYYTIHIILPLLAHHNLLYQWLDLRKIFGSNSHLTLLNDRWRFVDMISHCKDVTDSFWHTIHIQSLNPDIITTWTHPGSMLEKTHTYRLSHISHYLITSCF